MFDLPIDQSLSFISPPPVARITPYHPAEISGGTSISLREELDNFLRQYGHFVLLRRHDKHLHCVCYDEITQEASPACPYCNGTGWINQIERHKIRRLSSLRGIVAPNLVTSLSYGNIAADTMTLYFRFDVCPQEQDIVYEVTWDSAMQPLALITEYQINFAEDMRGDGGRLEYWRCAAKAQPINRKIHSVNIRRIRSNIVGEVWQYDLSVVNR